MRLRPDQPYLDTLARAWTAISGPHGHPYLRLFSLGRPELATVVLAVLRGLLMDLDATRTDPRPVEASTRSGQGACRPTTEGVRRHPGVRKRIGIPRLRPRPWDGAYGRRIGLVAGVPQMLST